MQDPSLDSGSKLSPGAEVSHRHEFGGNWTLIKLELLEKYLSAFNKALKKQNFTRLYIDAFAGTGQCDVKINGERQSVEGSARRALTLKQGFDKHFFIELSQKNAEALRALGSEYPGKSIEVIQGDANQSLKNLCRHFDWRDERAVLFLDPYGMGLEWATLEAIANTKAMDVWYLFPYSGLYRQAANKADGLDLGKEAALDRLLGTNEWRTEFYAPDPQSNLFGEVASDIRVAEHHQMIEYVSMRLKTIFPVVSKPKILFQSGDGKAHSGAPLFALYFAAANTDPRANGLALSIASDILKNS